MNEIKIQFHYGSATANKCTENTKAKTNYTLNLLLKGHIKPKMTLLYHYY